MGQCLVDVSISQMGCPAHALVVWVAFLNSPHCLVKHPKKKIKKKIGEGIPPKKNPKFKRAIFNAQFPPTKWGQGGPSMHM
jgi:hypothetical protein